MSIADFVNLRVISKMKLLILALWVARDYLLFAITSYSQLARRIRKQIYAHPTN